MKAISLRQPWASLWLAGWKVHETRPFRTHHRGWLLVHASSTFEMEDVSLDLRLVMARRMVGHTYPVSALLGAVKISRCEPTGLAAQTALREDIVCGDFSPGRWAWRAEATATFAEPIPYKGALGLFEVPDEVVSEALRLLPDVVIQAPEVAR